MKLKALLRVVAGATLMAVSPNVASAQFDGTDCFSCQASEGWGFATCGDGFGSAEGYRNCREFGNGCLMSSPCQPFLTRNLRVLPDGRVSFGQPVFVASVDMTPTVFRPIRDGACSGLIFALAYEESEELERRSVQARILI